MTSGVARTLQSAVYSLGRDQGAIEQLLDEVESTVEQLRAETRLRSDVWSRQLPDDCLREIFALLPAASVLAAGAVCKRWYAISRGDRLWRTLERRDFAYCRHCRYPRANSRALAPEGPWAAYSRWLAAGRAFRGEMRSDIRLTTLSGHTDTVMTVRFCDDVIVSGSRDGSIRVWDARQMTLVRTLTGHTDSVRCIVFLDDKRIASGSYDRTIRVWDRTTGSCLRVMTGHHDAVLRLAVSDERILISGSRDRTVRLWDIEADECRLGVLEGHEESIRALAATPTHVFSGGYDGTVVKWSRATQRRVGTYYGHGGGIFCLHVDGERVVAGDGANVRVWNAASYECTMVCRGHTGEVLCVQIERKVIASGSFDKTVRLWDRDTGHCLRLLEGHLDAVYCLKFNFSRLVTGSSDKRILVWDFQPARETDDASAAKCPASPLVAATDSPRAKRPRTTYL